MNRESGRDHGFGWRTGRQSRLQQCGGSVEVMTLEKRLAGEARYRKWSSVWDVFELLTGCLRVCVLESGIEAWSSGEMPCQMIHSINGHWGHEDKWCPSQLICRVRRASG